MWFWFTAPIRPYGTYAVKPTKFGLQFQVSVRDPRNSFLMIGLFAKSLLAALLIAATWWQLFVMLAPLILLDVVLYVLIAGTRLNWVEVRPDGLAIWPKAGEENPAQFFCRDDITHRQLDFDQGLSFRYGIHDIRATPGFANEREFEIFEIQFEMAIARLWHRENLDQ